MPGSLAEGQPTEKTPLGNELLYGERTVFAPGARIQMNIVPMFLNFMVPWLVFLLTAGLTGFWLMYAFPILVWTAITLMGVMCAAFVFGAIWARRKLPEPTWYSYTALVLTLMTIFGTMFGRYIYNTYTKNYYEIKQLKVLSHIDASQEHGQNLIDAGVMYFAPENKVNTEMSWHFKHHHIYCVAPVVTNKSVPNTQSYDFWAVGKDCCSIGSPDFRCGRPADPNVRAGIRLFKEEELPFFRLAVQQAETLYNVRATHPIFMYWVEDPLGTIEDAFKRAAALFLRGIGLALLGNALLVVLVAFKYSWIGRGQYALYSF